MKGVLTLAATCVLLSACGGSSSGGGGSTNFPAVEDFPLLPLDSTNADETISGAFQGLAESDSDIGSGFGDEATDSAASLAYATGLAQSYVSRVSSQARASETSTQACEDGGSATLSGSGNPETGAGSLSVTFNQCNEFGSITNGSFSISFAMADESNMDMSLVYNNIRVTEDGYTGGINGDMRMVMSTVGETSTSTISSTRLNMHHELDGNIVISDMLMRQVLNTTSYDYTMEVAYNLASDQLNGRVNVATPQALAYSEFANYPATGRLVLSGANGSSISLDADTGSLSTVMLTVFDGAVSTSNTVDWSSIDNTDFSGLVDF